MEKIIFADNTELEIKEGASLGSITATVDSWTALGAAATALRTSGNLNDVQFSSNGQVTGMYADMTLVFPLFHAVDVNAEGKIEATFAIREKTETEKRLDALEQGQGVQDGAIADLGEAVSTIAEGGEA